MSDQPHASLVSLARKIANASGLDPSLVCAVIEQESGWNPWAVRFEPEFERRYIHPALPSAPTTEQLCLAISWGLMQVMGQTARENGFKGKFLNALCDPETGISVGCAILSKKVDQAHGNTERALLRWNGGANADYGRQVVARTPNYK